MAVLNNYQMEFEIKNIDDLDSNNDITSVTANNNVTERVPSVIDDDVGSLLDLVPVRERDSRLKKHSEIEIVDVYTNAKLVEDESDIEKEDDKINWRKEVDKYDLNDTHQYPLENGGFSDENLETIIRRPQPLVTLTKHEPIYRDLRLINEPQNLCRQSISPDSTDIGRQITQLALRIESLGNISRAYEHNQTVVHNCSCSHVHQTECQAQCHEPLACDQNSLKTARKLDKVERLQKRQEAMQNRLTNLAKKLNDSTKDLTRPHLYNQNMSNDEDFHTVLPKTARKSFKKGAQKVHKSKTSDKSSSFLNNILNDIGEAQTKEVPLLSSSYCLHNDLSTGSPESVITDATSKYLNDELNNIRQEFRTQVEEIKRLLSDRYQQSSNVPSKEQLTKSVYEPLADQIEKSITKVRRDTSPSLRNITNVTRYEDQTCPLDRYLVRRPLDCELPSLESDITPSLRPGILPSVAKAIKSKQRMLSDPVEAERFLVELRNRRANLENNISSLERTKEGQFLFSILEKLQGNETSFETARIQAMVDDAIVSTNPEIQFEVKQEFQNWLEKRHQRQAQQEIEDEQQHSGKMKHPKATKIVQHVNYNQIPSASSVPQKPWLCKKYWTVTSKVDTGLKKPERFIEKVQRTIIPAKVSKGRTQETHSTYSNRRRYRTPYLHFVNDIKLAKKTIGPLRDESLRIPLTKSSTKRQVTDTVDYQRTIPSDNLVLLGVRQYSLVYQEEENVPEKLQSMATGTSPRPDSKTQRSERQPSPPTPPSPSMSEIGTGFHLTSKRSSKPREERVGSFTAVDPLEQTKMASRPINVMFQQPNRQKRDPDINNLRQMIERALYDQIEIPSPTTSTDLTLSVPKANLIRTPLPSDGDHYSEDFGTESLKEKTDYSMTVMDGVRTPDMSRMSPDRDHFSKFETPQSSPNRSLRSPPRRQIIPEKISEAVQTISDKGNQTIEDKQIQTSSPVKTQTQKQTKEPESVESFSTTSGLEGSLSDTQVESWSDGMWLLDRSEGEMAQHYLQPVSRWNLGSCPDNPQWPQGTEDLIRSGTHSNRSFGEFTKPTLAGLVPTVDGVLQLKTLPLRQKYEQNYGDEDIYEPSSPRRSPQSSFRLIRVSRDSKSRLTTPRSLRQSAQGSFQNSDGEVEIVEESIEEGDLRISRNKSDRSRHSDNDSFKLIDTKRSNDSYNTEKEDYFQPINIRRSNDSNEIDSTGPFKESHSDRMKIDPMKYLRGSKQSQSDFSDTGGLMSTGQVIAAAFKGGDSADFDGFSDHVQDNRNYYNTPINNSSTRGKQTVIIPTLESIDQSEKSHSEISEIILK